MLHEDPSALYEEAPKAKGATLPSQTSQLHKQEEQAWVLTTREQLREKYEAHDDHSSVEIEERELEEHLLRSF